MKRTTKRLGTGDGQLAGQMLAAGSLVSFPTETVYGLGADARNGQAVARIFEAKARPSFNPLIVHVADLEAAGQFAVFDEAATRLAQALWPGPLSLVLPLRAGSDLSPLVTAGLETVAIRLPAHELAREILQAADCPIAAPSANPSGSISPTTAAHVLAGLDGRIDAVIDGGGCQVGLESTILKTDPLTLLRPGGIPSSAIEACLGAELQTVTPGTVITAPGQMRSHYAPNSAIRLTADKAADGEILIGFGSVPAMFNLSPSGDLIEAAANLFRMLHDADALAQETGQTIAVSPIPSHGIGLAINDRLSRAAA